MGCELGREAVKSEVILVEVGARGCKRRVGKGGMDLRGLDACGDSSKLAKVASFERLAEQTPDVSSVDEQGGRGRQQVREASSHERQRSRSKINASLNSFEFECFPSSVTHASLPLVAFSDDVHEMRVWRRGSIADGVVSWSRRCPDLCVRDPIAMSPAYLGFALEPTARRVLQYRGVGIVFARPPRALFMQPSIDTVLLCSGLQRLFCSGTCTFRSAVDVGCGSGFIAKFMAVHAPGTGELRVALVDVDPAALQYSLSEGFAAPARSASGRAISWLRHAGDAAALLARAGPGFDLWASNPPYIPTREEVIKGNAVSSHTAGSNAFWEGTGLVVFLIERFAHSTRGAHLVLVVSSLTLKAPGVVRALETTEERGMECRCLLEREVAWKAWYAGPWGHDYLLATRGELRQRAKVAGLELFVGAAPPGKARLQTVADGRGRCRSYHWHVLYVLDFSHN
mmetsp:Transcript_14112/g.33201  ORF Transcript_14112/g.33201 Transcript_14112/m.33201 type:complete len:456 (-) Transcript_14112:95-1462(-)